MATLYPAYSIILEDELFKWIFLRNDKLIETKISKLKKVVNHALYFWPFSKYIFDPSKCLCSILKHELAFQ